LNPIRKLIIENFQSHQKTTITPALDGQLTVITGPSDAGKTVVLRALRWLLFNEPQGSDFIRVGASFARVAIELESGHIVIRERTKATNRYKIIAPDTTEPQVFEGFGSSVPLEVQELTGVRPVKIGDLELNLNLAEQLDGPFLGKNISAGARAKVLGKLAGTEEIDYAAKQLGTDLYRRGQDEKRLAEELAQLEEKIREFDWLPGMAAEIEQLEQIIEKIKTAQAMQNRLTTLKEQLAEADAKIAAAQAALWRWRNLKQVENLLVNITENQCHKETLVGLVDRYWTYQKSIWTCEKVIAKYAGLSDAETLYFDAEKALARVNILGQLKIRLYRAENSLKDAEKTLARLQGVEEAGKVAGRVAELNIKRDILIRLRNGYSSVMSRADQEQKALAKLAGVGEAESVLRAIGEKRSRWEKLVILRDKFAGLCRLIEDTRAKAIIWENRVAELEGAYKDELVKAGICPLCGQPVKIECLKEVI